MRRRVAAPFLAAVFAASCAAPPPPAAAPEPPPPAPAVTSSGEIAIGSVRVTATTLNVRSEPSTTASSLGQVRKGDRLTLIAAGDEWMKVQLADGQIGWVSKQHVAALSSPTPSGGGSSPAASTAPAREPRPSRAGCPADRNFAFTKTPTPAFSENGAHGVVTVEASVSAKGEVTSTRVVGNTTGDDALATLAQHEIAASRFTPPIRNCVAKAFIFTYKRAF